MGVATTASADSVAQALQGCAGYWNSEAQLQTLLADRLSEAGFDVAREVALGDCGRIDLMVDRVGIEVKVNGSLTAVLRQVHLYATGGQLDAVVLVSTRTAHCNVPLVVAGIPARVVWLSGQL